MQRNLLLLLIITIITIVYAGIYLLRNYDDTSQATESIWPDFISLKSEKNPHKLAFNSKDIFNVIIAKSPSERAQGLSDIDSIDNSQGMLFIFEKEDVYTFWMNRMNFDLDFIWIRNDMVVDIHRNVSHEDQTQLYNPHIPVTSVLEVNAGTSNSINIGDKVEFINVE